MNDKKLPLIFRIINGVSEISGYISGLLIFAASLLITIQVFLRYTFGFTTVWQMELTVYFLIFSTFVGAAYGLKYGSHVGVDVVIELLPTKVKSILSIFTSILGLTATVIIAWLGWEMWYEATVNGWHSSTAWGPPLTYSYIILPLGMTVTSLQFLVEIYKEILKLKEILKSY